MKRLQKLFQTRFLAPSHQGFSLLEVLVALLVISLFVNVAMTGLAVSAAFKSRARVSSEASTWIQEDLEAIRGLAAQLSYSLAADAVTGQPTVVLASTGGLAANDQIVVGTDSTIYTIQSINGNAVTLTTNLNTTQTANSRVVPVSKCNATASSTGFAAYLQQNLPGLASGGSRTIVGQPYSLTRLVTVSNTAPYDVLQLSYKVTAQNSGSTAATMYSEVIPNAVYQCPKTQ